MNHLLRKKLLLIMVVLLPAMLLSTEEAFSQGRGVISGTVLDGYTNTTLPGATISIAGTQRGTASDINGRFEITDVPSGNVNLEISFVGFLSEQMSVQLGDGETKSITIILLPDLRTMDEVVVIGYGTMRRSDLTGSVVSVTSEDLNRFPSANAIEMLRGQAAGVHVTTGNSSPGGSSNIRIRGERSLSSSQNPLYIVDGMAVPHIDDLNPNEIASIEILKDASSQAIYGARASNGVILVTTKRGEPGKVSVNLDTYMGFQQFSRNFELYTPEEWVELRFWAKYNEGFAGIGEPGNINYQAVIDDPIMYEAWENKNYTDWENLMLGSAVQHKHDLNIRGGSDRVKYSAAFGYLNQDGVVDKSGFERGNFRLNTDYDIADWLDIGSNISYSKSTRQIIDGTFNQFITRPSLAQPFEEDGSLRREVTNAGDINPLWRIDNYDNRVDNEYHNLSIFSNIKPFDGFTYRFSANIRSNNRESGNYSTKAYPGSTGEGAISRFARNSWLIDNVISYELPLDPTTHNLTIT